MAEKVFLEWGERFEWPDANEEREYAGHTCYGLSDQIGVLCDGTVVPCCLDADGAVSLGNIFKEPLSDILEGERAKRMRKSLEKHAPCEKLCKSCQYAASRYSKK